MSEDHKPSDQTYAEKNAYLLDSVHTKANTIGSNIGPMLETFNTRLADLADQIKNNQSKTVGAITLHLHPCGPGCLGCPHPKFYKWFNPNPGSKKWSSNVVTKPLMLMRRNEKFENVRPLIIEAQMIIEKRSQFIKQVSSINKSIIMLAKYDKSGLFLLD